MSVKALCIDDRGRTEVIKQSKWVKKGKEYEIIYTTYCFPQQEIGCHLAEIELTENEYPYQFFMLKRFAFTEENLLKLIELLKDCTEMDFSVDELLKETTLQEC